MGRSLLFAVVAATVVALPPRLFAQTVPVTTLIGTVVDSISGRPVSAARVSLGGDRGVATNSLGRFSLENVPLGTRKLIVTRLGYFDREAVIDVTDPMGGVRLTIAPQPLQIEGLSTKAPTEGDLRGRVIDADTGEPVPWAPVSLTKDGVHEVNRRVSTARSTNVDGDFEIADLEIGTYVLKVERPDYAAQLIRINHQVPEVPLQVSLSKDYRRIAALEVLTEKLDVRRNETGGPSVAVGAAALQSTAARYMDQMMAPGGFEADAVGRPDTSGREPATLPVPTLYIDGILQAGESEIQVLGTYSPKQFYRVDYVACPRPLGGKRYMLAYTYQYIEEHMMNPAKKDPMLQAPLCVP